MRKEGRRPYRKKMSKRECPKEIEGENKKDNVGPICSGINEAQMKNKIKLK